MGMGMAMDGVAIAVITTDGTSAAATGSTDTERAPASELFAPRPVEDDLHRSIRLRHHPGPFASVENTQSRFVR